MALQEEELSAVCRTIEYMSPELLHNGHEGKDGKMSPYDPRSTGKVEMHTPGWPGLSACQDVVLPRLADVGQVWPPAVCRELLHCRLLLMSCQPRSLLCSLSMHLCVPLYNTGHAANPASSACTLQMCGQRA